MRIYKYIILINIVCIRKWFMTKVGWTMPLTYVVGPVGPGAYSTLTPYVVTPESGAYRPMGN